MGVRTKHYDHRHRSQEASQLQNQPATNEATNEGANNNHNASTAEVHIPPPSSAISTTKPKGGGKSKRKSRKAKAGNNSNKKAASNSTSPAPPTPITPTVKPLIITIPKSQSPSVATILDQSASLVAVAPIAKPKKPARKRKQRARGGKTKITPTEPPAEEKVEITKKSPVGKSSSPLNIASKAVVSKSDTKSNVSNIKKDEQISETVTPTNNPSKNGILKTTNKIKKGMRNLMERTNKILERSRKKPLRKKSPVKPRILPARASARLCVRKNSGEHEQGMMRSDKPLRTVELIRRPLELREPATKLLYLASLSLYPTVDPESDTTPIVIISEEIPNLNGNKKPRMRNLELPLLPNWRCASFHPPSRATLSDDNVISRNSTASPDLKGNNAGNEKPSRKRKIADKKPAEQTLNPITVEVVEPNKEKKVKLTTSTADKIAPKPPKVKTASKRSKKNTSVKAPCVEINSATVEKDVVASLPDTLESQPTPMQQTEMISNDKKSLKQLIPVEPRPSQLSSAAISEMLNFQGSAMDLTNTMLKYPFDSGLTISSSTLPRPPLPESFTKQPCSKPSNQAKSSNIIMSNQCANLSGTFTAIDDKSSSTPFILPHTSSSSTVVSSSEEPMVQQKIMPSSSEMLLSVNPATNTDIITDLQTNKSVKSAPVKRKRKSLETIIKEIPKTKSHKLNQELTSVSELPMFSFNSATPVPPPPQQLPSSNPSILEGLMKNPTKKPSRKTKILPPLPHQSLQSMQPAMSLINMQNPVSMTVPLQPAPANSNLVPVLCKDNISINKEPVKQRNKKQQKPQFQLPMPLPIPLPPGLLNYASLLPGNNFSDVPSKPRKPRKPKTNSAALGGGVPVIRSSHLSPNGSTPNQMASIPYLPSHLQAFYHSSPVGNIVKELMYNDPDQALDLCVKAAIPVPKPSQPKKSKKSNKAPTTGMKSLLKPLNVEEDGPLNLVISRSIIAQGPAIVKNPDEGRDSLTLPLTETLKQQGNLENVKQMLARLHTKIAPAVNGVQLITIE